MKYLNKYLSPRSAILYLLSLALLALSGCTAPIPQIPAYNYVPPQRQIDYTKDVEPILVKRCVVCHSCYNSPCQLKLSSWEGLDRGASKEKIYNASRLKTMDPSRLFVDAHSTSEWREKGFFGVTPSEKQNGEDSLLYMLLEHKRLSPDVSGSYFPEASDLTCAENQAELNKYLKKHPNRGMPFGFPPLEQEEFNTVAGWLLQGARGPSQEQQQEIRSVPPEDHVMINKWEKFLNNPAPKVQMTARYLYEHLFLAHITFNTGSNSFFEIVRSTTPPGQDIEIIPTVRPYDNPEVVQPYYRFRKITSTIVHKTHMVFSLDNKQFNRVHELFIHPEWHKAPHLVGYDSKLSANPFETFEQIPVKSRYQWLLDNAHYIIMTFIRGPVCKGQVALNVINDHFWLLFLDPEYDLSVRFPGFLKQQFNNLRLPGENGSDYKLVKTLLANRHYKWAVDYYKARQQFYNAIYPDGLPQESIWQGNSGDDQPVLTVFRHFDSASVHRGVLGNLPNTLWVIDYPLLERIYYSLVAGFDVYGTVGHQLATRLYMDALRIEGETYFLDYLPTDQREPLMQSWYTGLSRGQLHYTPSLSPSAIRYETDNPKRELIERVVGNLSGIDGIAFDHNYLPAGMSYPDLPQTYTSVEDVITGFVAVSAPGISFFRHVSDHNANVAWIRIKNVPNYKDVVVSAVVDRWHDNVKFLFVENLYLNPKKDRADFIPGFIGSYPNYFFVVDYSDLPDFLQTLNDYDGSQTYIQKLEKYGINRAEDNFWEVYDWFQDAFSKSDPVNSGIIDLNRYYYLATDE